MNTADSGFHTERNVEYLYSHQRLRRAKSGAPLNLNDEPVENAHSSL